MSQEVVRASLAERQLREVEEAGLLDRGFRAEIINGDLVIQGAPRERHQRVVTRLIVILGRWTEEHGGQVYPGPFGVELDRDHSLRPDVAFVRPDRVHLIAPDGLYVGPDLVAEVSSRGTKSLDLVEKRDIYAALEVPEYWVVDLAADEVLVHRLGEAGYPPPDHVGRGGTLTPRHAPGVTIEVAALLS